VGKVKGQGEGHQSTQERGEVQRRDLKCFKKKKKSTSREEMGLDSRKRQKLNEGGERRNGKRKGGGWVGKTG